MYPGLRTGLGRLAAVAVLATAGLLAAAGGAGAQPATAAAATQLALAYAPIRNLGTGECMEPEGGTSNDARMVSTFCDGSDSQMWRFVPRYGSTYLVINKHSQLCLYLNGPVTTGSPVIQTECTIVSNEDWKPSIPPPGIASLMSRAGGLETKLCLSAPSMQIWPCSGSSRQQWIIGIAY